MDVEKVIEAALRDALTANSKINAQTVMLALTANGLTVVPVDLLAAALMAAQHSVTFPDVAFHLEKLLAKLDQPQ